MLRDLFIFLFLSVSSIGSGQTIIKNNRLYEKDSQMLLTCLPGRMSFINNHRLNAQIKENTKPTNFLIQNIKPLNGGKFLHLIKTRIAPVGGFKFGSAISKTGDTVFASSAELGIALIKGEINQWTSWGPLPLGWDWKYITLPYLSAEYVWYRTGNANNALINSASKFLPVMIGAGVSGGRGLIISLLPVPIGISGVAGIHTDFRDIYARGKVSLDAAWFSLGFGGYYNFRGNSTSGFHPNYIYTEICFHIWRDNWYSF